MSFEGISGIFNPNKGTAKTVTPNNTPLVPGSARSARLTISEEDRIFVGFNEEGEISCWSKNSEKMFLKLKNNEIAKLKRYFPGMPLVKDKEV